MTDQVVDCDQRESDRGVGTNLIQNFGCFAEAFRLPCIGSKNDQRSCFQYKVENQDPGNRGESAVPNHHAKPVGPHQVDEALKNPENSDCYDWPIELMPDWSGLEKCR